MIELLQFPFIQRALIAGIILAGLLAFLGIFVMLRKMAFFGDGIAHASLAGIAIGIISGISPMPVAVAFGIVLAVVIYFLEKKTVLSSDTIIGIIFTASMSLGVLLISLQTGYQPELISFLFGNILAIKTVELIYFGAAAFLLILFHIAKRKKIALLIFDRESAFLAGINVTAIELILYIALSVSVVLGVKVLGIILVSALLIIPPSTGKLLARSLRELELITIIIAELTVVLGILCSYYLDWPTGPSIVLLGTAIFVLALIYKKAFKL